MRSCLPRSSTTMSTALLSGWGEEAPSVLRNRPANASRYATYSTAHNAQHTSKTAAVISGFFSANLLRRTGRVIGARTEREPGAGTSTYSPSALLKLVEIGRFRRDLMAFMMWRSSGKRCSASRYRDRALRNFPPISSQETPQVAPPAGNPADTVYVFQR